MLDSSNRIIVVNTIAKLRLDTGCLVIEQEEQTKEIPICTIRILVLSSVYISITSALLKELSVNGVKVIFCDEKFNPAGEIIPYSNNVLAPNRLEEQILWTTDNKNIVWEYITKLKITMQNNLLNHLHLGNNILRKFIYNKDIFNVLQCEAAAAKLYFNTLFGNTFSREQDISINKALNYGYAIIRSVFNRSIAIYGYNNMLGIWHHGQQNQFNLACDLMEPFRPFIDKFVYENTDTEFDKSYKLHLIELLNTEVIYNNHKYILADAIDYFTRDILFAINNSQLPIKELNFA